MTTDKESTRERQRADLKARIARARRAIAYANSCEKASKGANFSPQLRAKTQADCEATRNTAKALLRILLAELEQLK